MHNSTVGFQLVTELLPNGGLSVCIELFLRRGNSAAQKTVCAGPNESHESSFNYYDELPKQKDIPQASGETLSYFPTSGAC